MKYLGIHKLIWFILILIWTFIECLYWFIISIAYWLWCFKWNWGDFTSFEVVDADQDSHEVYRIVHRNLYDNSIWDTIVRRYKGDFRI